MSTREFTDAPAVKEDVPDAGPPLPEHVLVIDADRKSTRLNSSH